MFQDLNIASRFQVFKGLGKKSIPVSYTAEEFSDVDKIKMVNRVCPFQVYVFDLERAVWWDEERLDWGEIGTNYTGRRIGICHFAEKY